MKKPVNPVGAGAAGDLLARRPGAPFIDARVEMYAQARATKSMSRSAEYAGVGIDQAKTWESLPDLQLRRRELCHGSQVVVTVSPAWVVEQLKMAAEGAQGEGKFSEAVKALELLYKILKTDTEILQGVAKGLPASVSSSPDALFAALSGAVDATPVGKP